MKVVTPLEMARIESLAIQEGASEEHFMDQAGESLADLIHKKTEKIFPKPCFLLLVGKGNNGGDAYVCGLKLLKLGYDVIAYPTTSKEHSSSLSQLNRDRFTNLGGKIIQNLKEGLHQSQLIIDGLFGTGFKGEVKEPYFTIIQEVNQSKLPVFAIDIPSGLNGETGQVEGIAIKAEATFYLELPKLGFFFSDGWNHVGRLEKAQFGLSSKYIDLATSHYVILTEEEIKPFISKPSRSQHKYQRGYVIGVAGSLSMPGAALLSSFASLRGGAGIMRLFYPEEAQAAMAYSPYEIIKTAYSLGALEPLFKELERASSLFVGPGLGTLDSTQKLLKELFPKIKTRCVVDADALNALAKLDLKLPEETVLTPHVGEAARLLKEAPPKKVTRDFVEKCRSFGREKGAHLVLKGAPTFICPLKEEFPIFINIEGNPGMATAGSGDVLTGILAAQLGKECPFLQGVKVGVFLHSRAGDIAAKIKTCHSLIAEDLIDALPQAFQSLSEA